MFRSFCACLCLLAGSQSPVAEPTSDQDRLAGLWQAVSLEANAQQAPNDVVKLFQIRFDGDKVTFLPDRRIHTFELVATADPREMDLTAGDGPVKGRKLPCAIYKFEGDRLIICIDKEGKSGRRPKEFKTTAGDGLALMTLERSKQSD
jgi:uncharacterized protein (TIGR03067 family)